MKKSRRQTSGTTEPETGPTPPLQAMGGKEERVSNVGRARADAERDERHGEQRFDLAPGPDTHELLHGHRRPAVRESKTKLLRRKISPSPRGGPEGLEPEDKAERPPARRRPNEQLPFEHGETED